MKATIMFFDNQILKKTEKAVLVQTRDYPYSCWFPLKLVRQTGDGDYGALIFDDMDFRLYYKRNHVCDLNFEEVQEVFSFDSGNTHNRTWSAVRRRIKDNDVTEITDGEVHHTPPRIKPIERRVGDEFKR